MSLKRFNTFEGVFTPCLLSILGVIMYLRLGWVVGQVGLVSAILIIIFANLITLATALSMSSIVTNIRIGTGGAYSIITKSLGVEAGGAVGIPLYLSQAISVAFYITGFSECWKFVFVGHDPAIVSLVIWFMILIISYYSAKLAFRIQYAIMLVVGLSIVSVFLSHANINSTETILKGAGSVGFWAVFAIFFPAVTGVLAGSTMSGELKDPKVSIPKGTLWAIGISFSIYIFMAVWFANNASANELVENTSILIDRGRWKFLIVAGIMGATLSSALSMFVGAPRTLLALAKHSIVPGASSFSKLNKKGEPAAAILLTSLLVLITLCLGTLNKVASLLTMIFLITYCAINLSVFIEQSIGIASFRPTFKISKGISFFGSIGCLLIMFLINIKFSVIAIFLIIAIYILLLRRKLKIHSPDVRSGLLTFMAEKFAIAAAKLPYHPKIWKPNLLVPVQDIELLKEAVPLIKSIVSPAGRVAFFKVIERRSTDYIHKHYQARDKIRENLSSAVSPLEDEDLFVETCVVESINILSGSITLLQALKEMSFPPNTLFYILENSKNDNGEALKLIKASSMEGLGIIVLKYHEEFKFKEQEVVNLWIRRGSPNVDLAILIALQLQNNWSGNLRIIQIVDKDEEIVEAENYFEKLQKVMRLPLDIEAKVLVGNFIDVLDKAPAADINIFGMPEDPDFKLIDNAFNSLGTSILLLRDSMHESAVA